MKMKTKSDFIYGYPHASGRRNAEMKKMTMIHAKWAQKCRNMKLRKNSRFIQT